MNLIDNIFELIILSNDNLDPGPAVQACNHLRMRQMLEKQAEDQPGHFS